MNENEPVESPEVASAPVEMSDMAKEIAALSEDSAMTDESVSFGDIQSDLEVPESNFWDNVSKEEPQLESEVEESAEEPVIEANNVPEESLQTITYKANGEELEISLDEARKKLAMAEGGAKAFTKLAKANKELAKLKAEQSQLADKAALLDKLESVKHDWRQILQIATGQDPDQFLQEVMRKNNILQHGSEAEKAQLEKEERLAQLERKLQAQQQKQEELERQEQERNYSSEKSNLKNMLEGEFFKHKFDLGNDLDSNDVNEMLWQQGQRRMTQYVKKYQDHPKFKELLPKMAQKSFADVAGKLQRLTTGQVQAEVEKAITQKKQKAAEKAAVASTRRIQEPNIDNFRGKGIRDIADMLVGKKGRFQI